APKSVTMGKKGDRGAKDKVAGVNLEEEGKNEYQCTGVLEQDFNELCSRAGLNKIPKVTVRLQSESDTVAEKEVPASLTQIQSKYAYFQPCIQTELEHEDPKSTREIFMRGWKIEEKMLGVFSKCLPALANLQAVHLWKVGLTDLSLLSLIAILPNCPNLKPPAPLPGHLCPFPESRTVQPDLIGDSPERPCRLAHVSLRNNNIGDADAMLIGQALSTLKSSNKSLVSLTLSFNHISDLGAGYIAEGLRLNRSLLCLSLAHNQIGDQGALKLAEVLGPFALTHTEVVERRRLLLEKESQERSRSVRLLPGHVRSPEGNRVQINSLRGRGVLAADLFPAATAACVAEAHTRRRAVSLVSVSPGSGRVPPPLVVSTPEQKGVRGKGTKSGAKEKRSLLLELEVIEPTEIVNPLLEQAEHRDGKVFLPGNRVLINLNLTCTSARGPGLAGNLPSRPLAALGPPGWPALGQQKNRFPLESRTFAKLQELMLPRDPTYRPKAPDEEPAAPS
uniref:Leucine rich repeat containing 71 n=1 Tax=Chelydra serpentina TaxID=8475 RepID=A0A8C3RTQ3_CHESE